MNSIHVISYKVKLTLAIIMGAYHSAIVNKLTSQTNSLVLCLTTIVLCQRNLCLIIGNIAQGKWRKKDYVDFVFQLKRDVMKWGCRQNVNTRLEFSLLNSLQYIVVTLVQSMVCERHRMPPIRFYLPCMKECIRYLWGSCLYTHPSAIPYKGARLRASALSSRE